MTGGRVTNSDLEKKLDGYTTEVKEWRNENEDRLRIVENCVTALQTVQGDDHKRIEKLEENKQTWNVINSIAAGVAALLAAVGISK